MNKELKQKIENWKEAKFKESLYKEARLSAEEDIESMVTLDKGANTAGDIKITHGNKVEWDTDTMDADLLDTCFI